jgi:N-methylhydantoinase B
MERFVFRPWGIAGGAPGETARVVVDMGTERERDLGKLDMYTPVPGEVVSILTPGGGGYGDPLRRAAETVLEDVELGYVSEAAARRDYGVVIADGVLDAAASEALRVEIARTRPPLRDFAFGPEREAWDAVFVDDDMIEMVGLLLQLPAVMRSARRRAIYEAVVPDLPRVGALKLHEAVGDVAAARARFLAELERLRADVGARVAA